MYDQFIEGTILLFVAVDPIALIPIFASLTQGLSKTQVRSIYLQATLVAFIILTIFWVFGSAVLDLMGISMDSFKIIGGLFLIAIAFQMVLEQRQDRRQNTADVAMDDESINSLAIFPLAIPLMAGPGAMTTALLLAENAGTEPLSMFLAYAPILVIISMAGIAMWLSSKISKYLGPTIITVVEKIFGLLLGALAIEFVIDGIRNSFSF